MAKRPDWQDSWVEWVPSVLKRMITSYGGGINRVADRMEVYQSQVRTFASGKPTNPTIRLVKKFCNVFDVPVIIFPEKWDNERKLRWLDVTHGKCCPSDAGDE